MFLTNICDTKYQNIADNYNVNGLSVRRHGNEVLSMSIPSFRHTLTTARCHYPNTDVIILVCHKTSCLGVSLQCVHRGSHETGWTFFGTHFCYLKAVKWSVMDVSEVESIIFESLPHWRRVWLTDTKNYKLYTFYFMRNLWTKAFFMMTSLKFTRRHERKNKFCLFRRTIVG